ncbi:hypothetical protein EST38_g7351 [Candolleomyces aberdarensis]|uniref:non-specific serine/threonine protein kinase n=1 Tax=Candolleomyces aberdarensis TaxID=2316362 RepID=A0A4Q2DHD2_9AGAR|nr:hypothetical protein EST38_g7351 [Candolleomyces aberdarensis]
MATAQAYQAYAQTNKGTLVPGQTISVNKYTVQVERYLSQGGFAHVYLVRTPAPVYGTTHHVLKRIAVANEAMLSEVKTEVDVMRVLKGHPNIVHLIDAAWHRMPNGQYEVFILMEYCPGGGIIDMMNRRLRERLTEAEILQIFVDVCEGVAFMHNSRPPLLHRDLKVENILQSSPTSYKLCDFGSATTISRPPTSTQEIRALEADLGRHTTMQYRAPEMIDLYSKRPIDEKSDVWALGVLLYKLCYYTTPFEEHGSLAILNVQYRIPPYPVYSSQMNMLIGSMLREHGTQRPTVFEALNHVHYLRGTKSQFTYNIPTVQPIAPKQSVPKPSSTMPQAAPNLYAALPAVPNSSRNGHSPTPPSTNAGAQAREKVLEAIAPMRRGRPDNLREPRTSSRQPSPQTSSAPIPPNTAPAGSSKESNWLDNEEAAWNAVSAQSKARDRANALFDEAWKVSGSAVKKETEPSRGNSGFENDFGDKLWRAPNPNSNLPSPPPKTSGTPTLLMKPSGQSIKPLSHTGSEAFRHGGNREKDAFEGLGLMTSIGKPAPTLAEARKLRTGLAIMSTPHQQKNSYFPSSDTLAKPSGSSSGGFSARPTPSPRPSYLSPTNPQGSSISPSPSPGLPTGSSFQNHSRSPSGVNSAPNNGTHPDGTPIEARFPSLEEIDAQFSTPSLYPSSTRLSERSQFKPSPGPNAPQLPPRPRPSLNEEPIKSKPSSGPSPPQLPSRPRPTEDSGRSTQPLQVTKEPSSLESLQKKFDVQGSKDWGSASFRSESRDNASLNPPPASRPKTSSITMKYALDGLPSTSSSTDTSSSSNRVGGGGEDKYSRSPKPPPKDWLTGDDEGHSTPIKQQNTRGSAILRETPAKRASVIIQDFKFQSPVSAQHDATPILKSQELPSPPQEESPTVSRFTKNFPPIPIDTMSANQASFVNEGLTDNWSPIAARSSPPRLPPKTQSQKEIESASSADEDGPEDLGGISSQPSRKSMASLRKKKGRQNSVHDLVGLWGGGVAASKPKEAPVTPTEEKVKPLSFGMEKTTTPKPRPTSLMPPLSGGSGSKFGIGGGGNVSPRLSPVQRAPSPISPSLGSFEAGKEATSPTTSTRTRSRPQSMFLFPSKSTDGNKPLNSPLLSPPDEEEDAPKLPKRRTSISNMVQRYEAIGGKVITPQQVTPGLRKVSGKSIFPSSPQYGDSAPTTTTRVKVFSISDKVTGSNANVSSGNNNDVKPVKDEFRPNRITVEPLKVRTTKISMPGGGVGSGPTESKRGFDVLTATAATITPASLAAATSGLSSSRPGLGHGKEASAQVGLGFPKRKPTLPDESSKDVSSVAFPKRKPTVHAADFPESLNNSSSSSSSRTNNTVNYSNILPADEEVSSSPERQYQGVGKLIDQWQRKSEETAKGGPGGGGVAKRAGLINRV